MPYLTVGEVADKFGCSPQWLSQQIYLRRLDVSRCPLLGGRRLIPESYLPEIERIIRRRKAR